MFIIDILLYVLFAYLMFSIIKKAYNTPEGSKGYNKAIRSFVLFYTFIYAVRWEVGGDFLSYYYGYVNGGEAHGNEGLWQYLIDFTSRLHLWGWCGMAIVGFTEMTFITKALREYRYILLMLPFAMFGSRYWTDLAGPERQMITASVFLFCTRFITDKKPWYYFILIYLASFIHHSAYMLLPLYFAPRFIKIPQKRSLLVGGVILSFLFGYTPQFQGLMNIVSNLVGFSGYEDTYIMGALTENLNGAEEEQLRMGPMMIAYLAIALFCAWYGPTLKEKYGERIKYFDVWYFFSYFFGCYYFLVCQMGDIFIRSSLSFILCQMVIASLLFYEMWSNRQKYSLAFYAYCAVFLVHLSWSAYKGAGYNFIFFN